MRVWVASICSLFAALSFAGCGTVVHGSKQQVAFASSPSGAAVTIDGAQRGVTPLTLDLKRNKDAVIAFSKDGYETATAQVSSVVSGWVAGNLLLGGIIGGAVDLASGAAFRLVPETVNVSLAPLSPGQVARDPSSIRSLTTEERLANLQRLRDQNLITEEEHQAQRKLILEDMGKSSST